MKRIISLISVLAVLLLTTSAMAAVDKESISKNVDNIVKMIDSGKDAQTIKSEEFKPYAFIMEQDGKMLVHPSLSGVNYKEKKELAPIYEALSKADAKGVWVQYEWKGKTKNTYARKTKTNLIVGSGY